MRTVLKVALYVLGGLLFLLFGLICAIDSKWGQDFIRGKTESYLGNKLKTKVHIGYLGYGLPKYIVIKDVLLLDKVNDTLAVINILKIDIAMFQLLHKKVDVQQILLTGMHSHIYRNPRDTDFNFTYIINAFSSTTPKEKVADTSSPFVFSLDKVKLNDIHLNLNDYTGGMQLAVEIAQLDLKMRQIDIANQLFHIKDLSIEGLATTFSKDTSYLPASKTPTKNLLKIIADKVNMHHVAFQYNDNTSKLFLGLEVGELQLQLNKFGMDENIVDLENLATKNTSVVLAMDLSANANPTNDTLAKEVAAMGWHVKAKDLNLDNVSYKMDDKSKARQAFGIDYLHLNFQNIALNMKGFWYVTDTISGSIKHFAGTEQCGLEVKELRTDFSYNPQGAVMSRLYFETPNTILQDHIEVHYPSVAAIVKRQQLLQLNLHVIKSILGVQDLLVFAPQLKDQAIVRKFKTSKFKIESSITGTLGTMDIAHFYVAGLNNTEVLLSGKLSGLPEIKDISYNLNIARLQTSRKDVAQLVPDSVLAQVHLPDRFGCTSLVSGTVADYKADMYLASTDGRAYIKGSLFTSPGKNRERYDVFVKTDKLNLGKILKQDSLLGVVSATIKVKGQSFDVKTMAATADGKIASAFVKGYRYHDVAMSGNIAGKQGDIHLQSLDTNIHLLLTGHGDFNNKFAAIKADVKIDSIDFRALNLYKTELRASGVIHIDVPVLDPDYPKGELTWWKPTIVADGKRYFLDSIYVKSNPDNNSRQNIYADLNVLQATIKGKTPLTKLAGIIQEHLDRHFTLPVHDSTANATAIAGQNNAGSVPPGGKSAKSQLKKDTAVLPTDYDLALTLKISDRPILHSLLPGLISLNDVEIDAQLKPSTLVFNANLPNIVYGSSVVQNGKVNIKETDSAFIYSVTADQVHQSSLVFWFADVHGKFDGKTLSSSVSLSDPQHKERFALAASVRQSGDSQVIQLQQGLKLNYKSWAVAQPNRIVLGKGGFYVQGFEISNSGQFIKAASSQPQINSPLKIDINSFSLGNITDIISSTDTLLAEGVLDGNVTIQKLAPSLQLTSDLKVKNLVIMRDTLGDLQLKVNDKNGNDLETKLSLNGQGNDIALDGSYYLQPVNGNDFDFGVVIKALKLHSFETLAMKEIHNSSGFIRGELKVLGTISAPVVTGSLKTEDLKTTVTRLNAEFKMPAEKITFSANTVTFNNFTLIDDKGNKAKINGDIGTKNLPGLDFDLNINATKWQALHSTINDNKEYYGDLFLTTNLVVKGTSDAPNIDGNIYILKGTKVTVVNLDSKPEVQSSLGIVEFVNMHDTGRAKLLVVAKKDTTKHKFATGTEINVNIVIPKEAEFSLILDQASGDFLTVKGDANLNTSVSPGGVISLSGNYALNGGAYQLNYNFIKRKFMIQDGSNMIFAGDPILGTTLDVTAAYEAKVPPYDLVMRQVPDPAQLNYYKQSLPFNIDLHLKGKILQPNLTFDVVLPENKVYPLSPDQIELVQGKLNQLRTDTTELNKQVFAVLILNRFVSDDPFSSSSPGLGFTALQSVSSFIGEQLNKAAGKFVKGVDISVDLATAEDYTSGTMQQRTDLNLAASKRLLNDRLKLTLGNDFELQGPQTNNQQSSYVPNNLAADYLLTADGKYTMRAYRRNYDEGVLEGYITQTGLDFIMSVDYNKFRYIFKKPKAELTKDSAKP